MNLQHIFEAVLLQEALKLDNTKQLLDMLKDEDPILLRASRRKSFPSFYLENTSVEDKLEQLVQTLKEMEDPNITQALLFILNKSENISIFNTLVSDSEGLYYYSKVTSNKKLFRSSQYRQLQEEPFNKNNWEKFVSYAKRIVQDFPNEKQVILDKYKDYCIFDSKEWKLYYTDDYEIAKHLAGGLLPYEYNNKILQKTRWCTSADTEQGKKTFSYYTKVYGMYIIKHFTSEGCDEMYQLSYNGTSEIELKDKYDACPSSWGDSYGLSDTDYTFNLLFNNCPNELLGKVKCTKQGRTLLDYKTVLENLNKSFNDVSPYILFNDVLPTSDSLTISSVDDLTTNVENVIISNVDPIIEKGKYSNCPSLVNVEIEEGVAIIDTFAFYHCENLKSVIIPSTVTDMSSGVFAECFKLSYIEIKSTDLEFTPNTFRSIHNLETVKTTNPNVIEYFTEYYPNVEIITDNS